jgi:hypothetical protein
MRIGIRLHKIYFRLLSDKRYLQDCSPRNKGSIRQCTGIRICLRENLFPPVLHSPKGTTGKVSQLFVILFYAIQGSGEA